MRRVQFDRSDSLRIAQATGLSDLRTRARTLIGESRSLTRMRSQRCNIIISLRSRKLHRLSQFRGSLIRIQESRRYHVLDDIVAYEMQLPGGSRSRVHMREGKSKQITRDGERMSI